MTPARRLAGLATAGLLGLVLPAMAHAAAADEDDWVVDDVTITPAGDTLQIAGTITPPDSDGFNAQTVTDYEVSITRTTEPAIAACAVANHREHLADGDDPPEGTPIGSSTTTSSTTSTTAPPQGSGAVDFSFDVPIECNGTYRVALVSAEADAAGPPLIEQPDPEPALPRTLGDAAFDNAPPDVQGVLSRFNATSRIVVLFWQTPPGYGTVDECNGTAATDHPDFAGYVVQRSIGDAPFTTLPNGTVAAGTQCLLDQLTGDAPLGAYRYRVLAARSGSSAPVLAVGGTNAVTTVAIGAVPATPDTTPVPTGPSGGGGGGGGGTGGAGTVTVGTVAPVLDDGTFEEELDYPEPGEEAAEVPEDAGTFLDFVPDPGPGILVPFAIAECLAVWAFHLRYLARRADAGH